MLPPRNGVLIGQVGRPRTPPTPLLSRPAHIAPTCLLHVALTEDDGIRGAILDVVDAIHRTAVADGLAANIIALTVAAIKRVSRTGWIRRAGIDAQRQRRIAVQRDGDTGWIERVVKIGLLDVWKDPDARKPQFEGFANAGGKYLLLS